MTKEQARAAALSEITAMSMAEREWASGAITDFITSFSAFQRAKSAFIYLSDDSEPDSMELTGLALATEKTVSVPRIKGADMQAVVITPYTNFYKNRWGILELEKGIPVFDSDIAVIPMRAFFGTHRLGRGKGYYDRYLAQGRAFRLGVAFECQCVQDLPCEAHDIEMDAIVTEKYVRYKDGRIEENIFGR